MSVLLAGSLFPCIRHIFRGSICLKRIYLLHENITYMSVEKKWFEFVQNYLYILFTVNALINKVGFIISKSLKFRSNSK